MEPEMELMEAVMEATEGREEMVEMEGVVEVMETVTEGEKVMKVQEWSPTASDLP